MPTPPFRKTRGDRRRNVHTYMQTKPKQRLFEVDLKTNDRNVNTYFQTQRKQELFEVAFKADSCAIVFRFFWPQR